MIVLLDRGFTANAFLEHTAATGADFLARLTATRKPPVLRRLPDGSFLSRIATTDVRVIECEITIATTAGRHTGVYRLATTLLDHRTHPAFELVKLYHERWEVESAYFAIKKSMLGRRVLRARTMPGIAQEVYALLTVYQAIRTAIADATGTVPGTDPDRGSFSAALQAARDQVVQAANVIAGTTVDLVGAIGRTVLDHLMPARRLRVSPRAVKRPLSRHKALQPPVLGRPLRPGAPTPDHRRDGSADPAHHRRTRRPGREPDQQKAQRKADLDRTHAPPRLLGHIRQHPPLHPIHTIPNSVSTSRIVDVTERLVGPFERSQLAGGRREPRHSQ